MSDSVSAPLVFWRGLRSSGKLIGFAVFVLKFGFWFRFAPAFAFRLLPLVLVAVVRCCLVVGWWAVNCFSFPLFLGRSVLCGCVGGEFLFSLLLGLFGVFLGIGSFLGLFVWLSLLVSLWSGGGSVPVLLSLSYNKYYVKSVFFDKLFCLIFNELCIF